MARRGKGDVEEFSEGEAPDDYETSLRHHQLMQQHHQQMAMHLAAAAAAAAAAHGPPVDYGADFAFPDNYLGMDVGGPTEINGSGGIGGTGGKRQKSKGGSGSTPYQPGGRGRGGAGGRPTSSVEERLNQLGGGAPEPATPAGEGPSECRNQTGYIGVRQRKWGMYAAEIRDGDKRRWLGSFCTGREAGMAYDAAAISQKGAKAKTNFQYFDYASIPRPSAQMEEMVRWDLLPKEILEHFPVPSNPDGNGASMQDKYPNAESTQPRRPRPRRTNQSESGKEDEGDGVHSRKRRHSSGGAGSINASPQHGMDDPLAGYNPGAMFDPFALSFNMAMHPDAHAAHAAAVHANFFGGYPGFGSPAVGAANEVYLKCKEDYIAAAHAVAAAQAATGYAAGYDDGNDADHEDLPPDDTAPAATNTSAALAGHAPPSLSRMGPAAAHELATGGERGRAAQLRHLHRSSPLSPDGSVGGLGPYGSLGFSPGYPVSPNPYAMYNMAAAAAHMGMQYGGRGLHPGADLFDHRGGNGSDLENGSFDDTGELPTKAKAFDGEHPLDTPPFGGSTRRSARVSNRWVTQDAYAAALMDSLGGGSSKGGRKGSIGSMSPATGSGGSKRLRPSPGDEHDLLMSSGLGGFPMDMFGFPSAGYMHGRPMLAHHHNGGFQPSSSSRGMGVSAAAAAAAAAASIRHGGSGSGAAANSKSAGPGSNLDPRSRHSDPEAALMMAASAASAFHQVPPGSSSFHQVPPGSSSFHPAGAYNTGDPYGQQLRSRLRSSVLEQDLDAGLDSGGGTPDRGGQTAEEERILIAARWKEISKQHKLSSGGGGDRGALDDVINVLQQTQGSPGADGADVGAIIHRGREGVMKTDSTAH